MRIFVIAFFLFFSLAPLSYAGVCPAGTQQNTDDGKYYYQSVECTPASGTVVGPQGTVQDRGGVVPSTQTQTGTNVTLINPLKSGSSIDSFLLNILEFVIRIGTVIVVLMVVFVGYKFVAAQGEPAKITEARSMLLWTVVGALILLGSQAIAVAIKATVGALSTGG